MAVASICSSPNPTISLPSLPPNTKNSTFLNSLQPHLLTSSSSSSKLGTNLVSTDAISISEAAEAVVRASAVLEAARDIASGIGNFGHFGFRDYDENDGVRYGSLGLEVRRKRRRRKRRKGLGIFDEEDSERSCSDQRILIGSGKSWNLSSREEAELLLCLKV